MIPRLSPALGAAEFAAAIKFWSGDVPAFERAFAALMDQAEAIAFPYGRTALIAVLKALALEGRPVICPAYTCVVVPHAIVTSGNQPVFIDSLDDDFNMDLELASEAVAENTGAIVATSIFGHPLDLEALDRLRQRHPDVPIIQDCAHSFGCCWKGRPLPLEGIAAFYGLNVSKIMTSVFGGMVTTDDAHFASRLRIIRDTTQRSPSWSTSLSRFVYLVATFGAFRRSVYGAVNALERLGALDRFVKYYDDAAIDMPDDYLIGMTDLAARVGRVQCGRYSRIVAHRRMLASVYLRELEGIDRLRLPPDSPGSTWSHFVVRSDRASELIRAARLAGIQLGELIEYHIPDMPPYRSSPYFGSRIAAKWPGNVINLPIHMDVSEADAVRISQVIRESPQLTPP